MKRFLILFFLTACTWPTCGGLRAQVNPTPQQVSPLNEERWVLPEHYALDLGAGVTALRHSVNLWLIVRFVLSK